MNNMSNTGKDSLVTPNKAGPGLESASSASSPYTPMSERQQLALIKQMEAEEGFSPQSAGIKRTLYMTLYLLDCCVCPLW